MSNLRTTPQRTKSRYLPIHTSHIFAWMLCYQLEIQRSYALLLYLGVPLDRKETYAVAHTTIRKAEYQIADLAISLLIHSWLHYFVKTLSYMLDMFCILSSVGRNP